MGAVNAQTTNIPLPPALLACAEETDVLRRLACYDREVVRLRDVPESVPEPAPEPTVAAPGTLANPEEETECRRAEAERKLLEELERQRAENEHLRREAEAAEIRRRQQQEIETEQRPSMQRHLPCQTTSVHGTSTRTSFRRLLTTSPTEPMGK